MSTGELPDNWKRLIERVAKVTVEKNLDPGRMMSMLWRFIEFRNKVWPQLTQEQRDAIMAELKARQARYQRDTTGLDSGELHRD